MGQLNGGKVSFRSCVNMSVVARQPWNCTGTTNSKNVFTLLHFSEFPFSCPLDGGYTQAFQGMVLRIKGVSV